MVDETLGPLDSIVAWLDAMAPELRDKDFLPQILVFTPRGLLYQKDPLDPWEEVRTRIGALPSDPFRRMPTVLALIAAIDMVLHGRETKADWADNKRRYRWIVEYLEEKGNATWLKSCAKTVRRCRSWQRTGSALPRPGTL